MLTEYVAGFLFSKDKKLVLLIRKARPEWQKGKLNAIGGHIEPGESAEEAMRREFHEEVNAKEVEVAWRHKVTLTGPGWRVYFFVATCPNYVFGGIQASGVVFLTGRGDEKTELVHTGAIPEDVIPNLHWLIPLCLDDDIGSASVIDLVRHSGTAKITLDTPARPDL